MIDIWESGEIYARLLIDISNSNNWINKTKEIYNSFICQYINKPSNLLATKKLY